MVENIKLIAEHYGRDMNASAAMEKTGLSRNNISRVVKGLRKLGYHIPRIRRGMFDEGVFQVALEELRKEKPDLFRPPQEEKKRKSW